MHLHENVVAEMLILVGIVASFTEVIVFTVSTFVEIAFDRLGAAILTVCFIMFDRRFLFFFEIEHR